MVKKILNGLKGKKTVYILTKLKINWLAWYEHRNTHILFWITHHEHFMTIADTAFWNGGHT